MYEGTLSRAAPEYITVLNSQTVSLPSSSLPLLSKEYIYVYVR